MEMKNEMLKQDSIKVTKTATGKYTYEMKLYYDSSITNSESVINDLHRIYKNLELKFGGEQ